MQNSFTFTITAELGRGSLARAGRIHTPHGDIETPAFIVVGTKAAVKAMVPEQVKAVHAQAVLATRIICTCSQGTGWSKKRAAWRNL